MATRTYEVVRVGFRYTLDHSLSELVAPRVTGKPVKVFGASENAWFQTKPISTKLVVE
jgi:hypothetical protein